MHNEPGATVGFPIASRLMALAVTILTSGMAFAEDAIPTPDRGPPKPNAPAITVVEARRITFIDNVLVTGSLAARDEILVGPEIDGYRIVEVLGEEGDTVRAGQVLARLARDALEAQTAQSEASANRAQAAVDQAKNQIIESEASLKQAEDAFNRVKPLRESGVASQATFDERELGFRGARARLAAQREGLRLAEADRALILAQRRELDVKLDHTEIKTPAAGVVSRRTARTGAMSSSSADALFRVIRDGEVELDAEVPEFSLSKLKAGQSASVELSGLSEKNGKVRLVSPEVNTASRLGRARIFLGTGPDLRIGTFAKAMIDAGQRDALGVPSTAVLYQNDMATVLIVEGGKVKERTVKTGLASGDNVEIREGLKPGDIVVLRAGSLLRSGDTITPIFTEKQTATGPSAKLEARQ